VPQINESAGWRCTARIEDFEGEWRPGADPVRVVEASNLLMHGGASLLWEHSRGNGTTTAGQALTYLNNANAAIGAGTGATAVAATQTNLQGATRARKGMDPNYPEHTDGTGSGTHTINYRATFGTADANFDWQEVGVFNSPTDGIGRMLNRLVSAIGTKTSAVSRVVTVTISIA